MTKPANAAADGEVFLQPSDTPGRVNVFLRNPPAPAFLDTGLAYLVYRGILRSSLVEADGVTLRQEPGLTERAWAGRSATNPPTIDDLITDVQGRSPAEAATELAASDGFVAVRAGDPLGQFATDSVSLDVVLADPAPRMTATFLRAPVNELDVDTGGLTGDARWLVESLQRSRLLGFLDPCHFFTPLWHAGLLDFAGQPPPQWAQWINTWAHGLLSTFDLRNEHDRPLNFYRDLGPDIDTDPKLQVRRSDEPVHLTDVTTQNWPLVRGEWLANDQVGPAQIQFPLGAAPGAGIVHVRGPGIDRIDNAAPGTDAGFTRPIDIHVPRHDPVWLPTWFTLRYRRDNPVAGGAGADYRPPDNHRFDALLDRSWLAEAARRPPAPWTTELRSLVRRALIDRIDGNTRPIPVWLGHAVDDHGVYLLARPDRPSLDRVAPVMRSTAPRISDDGRLAALLPSLAEREIRTAAQVIRVPAVDPGPGHMVVAMTHAEFAALVAAIDSDPDRSIGRIHVLQQPDPAAGIHRFTLGVSSAQVTDAGNLQTSSPSPQPDGPIFDVEDPDSSILLSTAYLESLAAPSSNTDMDQSFIRSGVRLTLRDSPAIDRIDQPAWQAAGQSRFAVADDAHNAIGQTVGDRSIRVSVLGHKARSGGDRAMLVEILEPVQLIHPADVESNYDADVREGEQPPEAPATPRYVDLPPGQLAWVIMGKVAEQGLMRVASLAKFERDLDRLLKGMEAAEPDRSLADHLTHLRMLTQIRDEFVDVTEAILSRLFDVLIGTVEDGTFIGLNPTVDSAGLNDPILADTAEAPVLRTLAGVDGVDTTLSLLADYGSVHLGGDLILDLFHMCVGLDVMRDHAEAVTLRPKHVLYAAEELPGDSLLVLTDLAFGFEHPLPDRVAASLWIGDVAASYAKERHHKHRSFEDDWRREHGEDLGLAPRAFRLHYFAGAAGDIDLVPDVLAYRLAPDIRARFAATGSVRQAVLDGFRGLATRMAAEGLRPTAEAFVDRIADDAMRGGSPNLVHWIEHNLERFAAIFEMVERFEVLTILPFGDNPFEIPDTTWQDVAGAVRVRTDLGPGEPPPLANLLIDWIEAVSGRNILDQGGP